MFDCNDDIPDYHCKFCHFPLKENNFPHTLCNVIKKNEVKWNECEQCSVRSYSILWSFRHQLQCESKSFENNERTINNSKKYQCKHCTFTTNHAQNVNRHFFFAHLQTKRFKCDYCSYKTHSSDNFKRHNKSKHTSSRWHMCDQCDFKTKNIGNLKIHSISKHSKNLEKRFKCTKCPFETHFLKSLKSHQITKHTPDDLINWLECGQCKFKAKITRDLRRHTRIMHNYRSGNRKTRYPAPPPINDKKYKCTECLYQTQQLGNLHSHQISRHTSQDVIKWLGCDHCKFRAKWPSLLARHMKDVHGVQKNTVKCDQCDYVAKHHQYLTLHIANKHGTPLKCADCTYTTKVKSELIQHMLVVHRSKEIKIFKCINCSFATISKTSLAHHKRNKHNLN